MSFSIEKYMGCWYQQYAMPSWFDVPNSYNIKADYQLLPTGEVSVRNTCETDTEKITIDGVARVVAPFSLVVNFGYEEVAEANYNITIGTLDGEYVAALVTDASYRSLFVLTRQKLLTPCQEYSLLRKVKETWDLTLLQRTLQI